MKPETFLQVSKPGVDHQASPANSAQMIFTVGRTAYVRAINKHKLAEISFLFLQVLKVGLDKRRKSSVLRNFLANPTMSLSVWEGL